MNTAPVVRVLAGATSLEERPCRLLHLRNGRRAAVWRGLAYELSEAGTIDVEQVGVPPADCLPSDGFAPAEPSLARWALVEGADDVWLLLSGDVMTRDAAAAGLRGAGLTVLRSGAGLGDVVDGFAADWFVRFLKPSEGAPASRLVEAFLGPALALPAADGASESDGLRAQILERELFAARAQATALVAELGRLRAEHADDSAALSERVAALEKDFRDAQTALMTAAAVARTPAAVPAPAAATKSHMRLQDEVATALKHLAPSIELLRDSLVGAAAEFRDRAGLYRAMAELAQGAARLPPSWKKLKGVPGWWERHVSNGEDDSGRCYARFVGGSAGWEVLLSHKAEQDRDIAWLRARGG